MSDGMDGKSLLIGILAGAAAGIAVGYLTAPQSGKETREMLRDKAVEIKDKAGNALSKVRDAACAKVGAKEA
jgi:gas vesicle protein